MEGVIMRKELLIDPFKWINDETTETFEFEDILYNVAIKIFDIRMEKGLNQSEFADLLGVSQSMVSKLESGDYNPTLGQLYKLSKKLDIRFDIIFGKYQIENSTKRLLQKNQNENPAVVRKNEDQSV